MRRIVAVSAVISMAVAASAQRAVQNAATPVIDPQAQVNEEFNLYASSVATLDVDASSVIPAAVDVPLDGSWFTLELTPYSVRSQGYQLLVQQPSGEFVPTDPGPITTFRGVVAGLSGSFVVGGMVDGQLFARVELDDQNAFYVEPIRARVPGFLPNDYVIYRAGDSYCEGSCGTDTLAAPQLPLDGGSKGPGSGFGNRAICTTELACDADFEFFQSWGSVANVQNRINTVINAMNTQYENDVAITHAITTIIVRTNSNDPYSSNDAGTLLSQFTNHWQNQQSGVQRDVAELFTGKNLNGGVIGVAWLSGICNSNGYNVVQSDIGSFSCVTDLSAHELGHNWSAVHCSCTNNTMNPFITCSNVFHPTQTVPDIANFRDSRNCLNCAGGNPTDAPPFRVVVKKGTVLGGGVPEIDVSDNNYLTIASATAGTKERTNTKVKFLSPITAITAMTVTVETSADTAGVTTFIYVWNYASKHWDRQQKFTQPVGDTVNVYTVASPASHIKANGRVQVRIFMKTNGTPFTTTIDHAEVIVE